MPHFVRPRSHRCSERAISAGERLREEGVVEGQDETISEAGAELISSVSAAATVGRFDCLTAHSYTSVPQNRTFGVTIGVTILQNSLKKTLPPSFLAQFPSGMKISYAVIPILHTLFDPLRSQVEHSFAIGMTHIWYVVVGIAGLGLVSCLPAQRFFLREYTDETWGFEDKKEIKVGVEDDVERGEGDGPGEIERGDACSETERKEVGETLTTRLPSEETVVENRDSVENATDSVLAQWLHAHQSLMRTEPIAGQSTLNEQQ